MGCIISAGRIHNDNDDDDDNKLNKKERDMADYQGALTGQEIDALPGLITAEAARAAAAEAANAGNIGDLSALQTTAKGSLVAAVNEVKNTAGGGEGDEIARVMGMAMEVDSYELPLLCGQPQKLFGAGTPQEAIVPDNWRQFNPDTEEGYNWNGVPTAIGQEYINTAVASGGRYIAVRDGDYSLKWVNS